MAIVNPAEKDISQNGPRQQRTIGRLKMTALFGTDERSSYEDAPDQYICFDCGYVFDRIESTDGCPDCNSDRVQVFYANGRSICMDCGHLTAGMNVKECSSCHGNRMSMYIERPFV